MAAKATSNSSGGIGLGGAVFIVFLVLKLTDKIDWSWWWVTAPLWGAVAMVVALALTLIVVSVPFRLVNKARHGHFGW